MKQSTTSLSISTVEIPTTINETLSIDDKMISSSSPSIKKRQSKEAIVKSLNNPVRFLSGSNGLEQQMDIPQNSLDKSNDSYSHSQQRIVPTLLSRFKKKRRLSTSLSVGQNKLNEIIQDLNENPFEEEAFKEETFEEESFEEKKIEVTALWKWIHKSRHFIVHIMEQPNFHYAIIALIIIDLVIVFIELVISQLSLPCLTDAQMIEYNTTVQPTDCLLPASTQVENGELAIFYVSLLLISIFVLEILTAFYAFGWRRYIKLLYLFDAIIVFVSFVLEVYFHYGNVGKAGKAAAGLVVLRLWKIIRAIHAIAHSMSLRNHMIVTEINKAKMILNEEKIQAEETIQQQKIQIDYLTKILEKNGIKTNQEQINGLNTSRANSLASITLF